MDSSKNRLDRLYELLPVIHRMRDHDRGEPLRALLRVIAEQVNLVEDDIAQLYENWFIETCEDWVVPYLGDLIGYRPVHEAGEPGDVSTAQGRLRNKILISRREVANTVRYRRRKGSLALLELLANDVAGWPARAVEFYRLLAFTQSVNHLRTERGRTVDLRNPGVLAKLGSPFDTQAHTADARLIDAADIPRGRYNIPSVGLFVCRLRSYSATKVMAYHVDPQQGHYSFSPLGNNQPLFVKPERETDPTRIAGELNLPLPISRCDLLDRPRDYYGEDKSLHIWTTDAAGKTEPIPVDRIVAADLRHWVYRPKNGKVAVDPERGRIVFPRKSARKLPKAVWVTYRYGFSDDLGGGEYPRPVQPVRSGQAVYYVAQSTKAGTGAVYRSISAVLAKWRKDADAGQSKKAVIEITDNGVYVEQPEILIKPGEQLELRAAQGKRPLVRLLNVNQSAPDVLRIVGPETAEGENHGCVTLDGLLITGRGLYVEGLVCCVTIRHCTLVPGWDLEPHCEPLEGREPSIELIDTTANLAIEHSIVGSIEVSLDKVKTDPLIIRISDSVLDATSREIEALSDAECGIAHAVPTIVRSTVIGAVRTHAIELAENSIFMSELKVARRQIGCMRFCYVPPGSRTPRRYHCQPDVAEKTIEDRLLREALEEEKPRPSDEELERAKRCERDRVRPQFNSTRYGTPTYCRLACACVEDIKRGADDESEMGVFHDLYQPQRAANLRVRLEEFTPAGAEAEPIYIN